MKYGKYVILTVNLLLIALIILIPFIDVVSDCIGYVLLFLMSVIVIYNNLYGLLYFLFGLINKFVDLDQKEKTKLIVYLFYALLLLPLLIVLYSS